MKKIFKQFLNARGYELINARKQASRRVGSMENLLVDIKNRGFECRTILDVGANTGSWSRLAMKVFPGSEIWLIEPQEEMKAKLENFCTEFPGSRFIMAGAGAEKDALVFTVWDDLAGSSFLPKTDLSLIKSKKQREVPVIPINDLIRSGELPMPDLI